MVTTVKEVMLPNPMMLRPEQSVPAVAEIMLLNGYELLYVVDDENRPVGAVTALQVGFDEKRRRVNRIMLSDIVTVSEGQPIQEAALAFGRKEARSVLPVVDGRGAMVGILRLKDIVKDLAAPASGPLDLTPEALVVQLAMTHTEAGEEEWSRKVQGQNYVAAVTQVGTSAEKLPVKLRESAIVAAIAHGVIREDPREKVALSNAIRDIVLQMDCIAPGLGGGYKLAVVRGEGRISVAACGRTGHALASSPEQVFVGTSII